MSTPVIIVSAVITLLIIVVFFILYKKYMKNKRHTITLEHSESTKQSLSRSTTPNHRPTSKAISRLSIKKAIPILAYRIITSGGSNEQSMLATLAFKMLLNKLGVNWNECKKHLDSPNLYDSLNGIDETKIIDAVILIPRMFYEITGDDRVRFDKLTLAYLNEFKKIGYTEDKLREMMSDFDNKTGKAPNETVSKDEIEKKEVKKIKTSPSSAPDLPFKEYAIPILFYKIGQKGSFDENSLKDTDGFCEILLDAGVFWDQCKPYIDAPNLYDVLVGFSQIDISVYMISALKMISELVEKDSTKEEVLIKAFYEEFGKLGFSKEKIDVMVWTTMNMAGN